MSLAAGVADMRNCLDWQCSITCALTLADLEEALQRANLAITDRCIQAKSNKFAELDVGWELADLTQALA